ncbi:uncharacterized protein BDZ83DRAFT_642263 [Colletotrichum acutatum]|uniref:Uncharacterized protein n=1 Tax=Glomerella acutata TaxID=27357 RepID=A0AAD8U6G1_GLOAC|nr:uncharacterized protein BDZ83DRAFT_642263 [Colletotrichum acutatum]KAK1708394.1 hypothetical protein BDZ83DRAFT_642263 [Colletotrichum acutatum]
MSVDGGSLSNLLNLQFWLSTMPQLAHSIEQVWFTFEKLDGEISAKEKAHFELLCTKAEVTNGQPRRINHSHIWESPIYPVEAQISIAIGHLLLALPSVKQVGFDKKLFLKVMDGPNFQSLPLMRAPSLNLVEESESPVSLSWQTILTLCQLPVEHLLIHGKINFDVNRTRGQIQDLDNVKDITFDEVIMEGKGTGIPQAPKLEAVRYLSPQAQGGNDAFFQFKTIFDSLTLDTSSLKMLCLSFPNMPDSRVQYELSSMLEKLENLKDLWIDLRSGKQKKPADGQNEFLKYVQSEEFIMKLPKSLIYLSLTGDFSDIDFTIHLAANSLKDLNGFGISVPDPNSIFAYNRLKLKHSQRLNVFSHKFGGAPVDTSAWDEMKGWKLTNPAWKLS